jgi:ABC-type Fe3+-hydroxamate transport system substrate-binding protein
VEIFLKVGIAVSVFLGTLFNSMKLTLLTPALVALLGLALASSNVHAQTTTTPPPGTQTMPANTTSAPSTKTAGKQQFGGTVTAVDAASNTVSVHSKKHDVVVSVDASTKLKGFTAIGDVAVGDKVSGTYETDGSGKMMALSLSKRQPKAAKTTAAPAAQ